MKRTRSQSPTKVLRISRESYDRLSQTAKHERVSVRALVDRMVDAPPTKPFPVDAIVQAIHDMIVCDRAEEAIDDPNQRWLSEEEAMIELGMKPAAKKERRG